MFWFSFSTCQDSNGSALEGSTDDIAQMLGMMDPWYERSVLSLLSLPPDVLCQVPATGSIAGAQRRTGLGSTCVTCPRTSQALNAALCPVTQTGSKDGDAERLPLLADLLLYYCRHAQQPVLVQLYRAEVSGSRHTHGATSQRLYERRVVLLHS